MSSKRTTIALALAGLGALWLALCAARAQEKQGISLHANGAHGEEKMRISLDTNAKHVRNRCTEMVAAELKKRIGNKIAVESYPSAQLFRDRDIPKALRQNASEMGIPGTCQ